MHEEALTQKAAVLFPHLAQFKNFYLVGGTALALQIGHRISVDFDMFSQKPLSPRLLQKIRHVFDSPITVTYRAYEQLNVIVHGIQCTFFYFEYPIVRKLKNYQNFSIASVPEIAAMKAFSIGRRLSYKDYVDWYFLLKEGYVTLAHVIKIAQKKFGQEFNDRLFLGQLVSMSDIKTQKINFLRDRITRKTVEQFLEKKVKEFRV